MSKPDVEPDSCALNNVHYRHRDLELRVYAPERPCVTANIKVTHINPCIKGAVNT